LSITARGGKKIHTRTRRIPIGIVDLRFAIVDLRNLIIKVKNISLLPTNYCLNKWSAACSILSLRSAG
jgi:hypothetical protein